ncbi:zinc finger protein 397-like isoform X5 [Podarcis raffonei]|uniref:zinc finger protein 397-like isoform X5 n=1 Tax=Podarcis raffonei TaxID=65483 RepID=UPI00232910E0|nr:zinc finger protein 397-like isoform X5 [Podarcis raffonei]
MKKQKSTGPELELRPDPAGKASRVLLPGITIERPGCGASEDCKGGPGKGRQERWEAQWQQFLKTLQPLHPEGGSPPETPESAPWEDASAFLASFEQVAKACRWPRGEWAARLLPALSGEADEAFQSLEAGDREDYGKVKAAILRGVALRMEAERQHFRQFCCQQVEDPRRIHLQLQDLCHRWLKPERRSKEQILELLVLEQFLASLPPELQSWIRAGGPESCGQAVALAEEFLMAGQQVGKTDKWQGPLQEVCLGSLDAVEEPSDPAEGQVCYEGKQESDGEIRLLGSGIKCSGHSSSLSPAEGQRMADSGLNEGLVSVKEAGVSLHLVEPTLIQPGQQTMFWQVLQEEDGSTESLGDGKRSELKVEASQYGGNEPEPQPDMGQGNGPMAAELCEKRCDGKRHWIKMEKSQLGETLLAEAHRTLAETSRWDFPGASEIFEDRWESKDHQEKQLLMEKKNEYKEVVQILPPAVSAMQAQGGKLFSKQVRKSRYKSGLLMIPNRENAYKSPTLEENVQLKCFLDNRSGISAGERQHELSEGRKSVRRGDGLIEYQNSRTQADPYECPEERKNIGNRKALKRDQGIQTEGRRYQCTQCGKFFRHRQTLTKHQKIHTGEKLHECPACGKGFTSREPLLRHQRIHTGEKPYECPQCGKCFRQRVHLMCHQKTHTGEKPFKCPECGRNFSRRDKLIRHQRIHRGQRPYSHPEGGKSFDQRATLVKHQGLQEGY